MAGVTTHGSEYAEKRTKNANEGNKRTKTQESEFTIKLRHGRKTTQVKEEGKEEEETEAEVEMSRSENELESEGEEEKEEKQAGKNRTIGRCKRCPAVFEKSRAHKLCTICRGCICAGGQGKHAQQEDCWMHGTEKAGWLELNAEIAGDCEICEGKLVENEMVWVSEETSHFVVHAGCKQKMKRTGGIKWYKALLPWWGNTAWYPPGGVGVRRQEGCRECHKCGETTTPAERLFCSRCTTISCGKDECGCAHARVLMEVVEEG